METIFGRSCRVFMVVLLVALAAGVSNAWALDEAHALKTWNTLVGELEANSGEADRRAKSRYSVLLEGYVVSGTDGLIFATQQRIQGPISRSTMASLAYTLYDNGAFALYSYNGYLLHAWFTGSDVSVVLMTADLQ